MHDNMTVAWEIRYPWVARRHRKSQDRFLRTYHDSIITIWHRDPETDGTDDSCDWSGRHIPARYEARLKDLITNPDDNLTYFFGDVGGYEAKHRLFVIAANVQRIIKPRPWWRHPRWHVWHWRLQCHPLQKMQRRLFTRCAGCGKRFTWGAAVYSLSRGGGPRWFRSERGVYHGECADVQVSRWDTENAAIDPESERAEGEREQ